MSTSVQLKKDRRVILLPAVWFSWAELFTATEKPTRNNTIVTVGGNGEKEVRQQLAILVIPINVH